MILLLAAPAGGAVRRDTVIEAPSVGSARISATAETGRYPTGGAGGETVAIGVTAACRASCGAADPQRVADFLGTIVHGREMGLLTVQLDTPAQIAYDCGYGAQACYYGGENKIVLSGEDTAAPDGASREFVLAHEYGHHIARHRESPPPFPPAIDWGTARWSSYENVCRRSRTGALFPGNEGLHYFRDPGEAFAESYAHMRFPESDVPWRWVRSLEPDAGAFEAIRADVLDPWHGRSSFPLRGHAPPRRNGSALRTLTTPLDGMISLRPAGRAAYSLSLLNSSGSLLRSTRRGLSLRHRLNFTVCGQSSLRLAIRSLRRLGGTFRLQVQRP